MKRKITLYYLAIFVVNLLIAYGIINALNHGDRNDAYSGVMDWLVAAVYSLLIACVLFFVVFKHHKIDRG